MSEKPVVNAQECDPSTLGLARKPRPAMKRKPQTEVVVQLGPFTEGQITAPEMVRPLEGPTEWLINPKTGEIVPFDAGTPPEKDVIRKYITVGAQDNDVPEDLPKLSEGYVIERVNQEPLPSLDGTVGENGVDTVRVVEREGPASVDCESTPPTPPVNENEEPPPVEPPPVDPPPPVDQEEDCECPPPPYCPPPAEEPEVCDPPPPYCPPVDEQEECETPPETPPVTPPVTPPPMNPPVDEQEECEPVPPPYCPPVNEQEECDTPIDAVNDCATTQKNCPVTIDVMQNDIGCGDMEITEASAENGSVEIKDGKLHYTPNEGFCGEDVISYTIGDENCMTDTAHVYMTVESGYNSGSDSVCDDIAGENSNADCPTDYSQNDGKTNMHDHEYSSESYESSSDSLFADANSKLQEILDRVNNVTESKAGWSSNFGPNSMEASACAPAEEPAAVC
ncbi:Ig-like domain-containing protein [Limnobacter parvus]|uniref:Ig-like domain-containing protein n=1 Tax=Limnobacter parvus TaxID=2939690 RepID=A0ABT1XHV0_9BURK|nr:Ig-like domain-containing protein [Limnobacter parvus]MCR2746876.1 Ig-like domain-containing protein [Limnobacter parvus]